MATAQVVSATTALQDEKIEEQEIKKPQEDINNTNDQETPITESQPQEKPADCTIIEPEPEPKVEPEPEPKSEPELEPKALEVEIETKAVIKEEVDEAKDSHSPPVSIDQPAKVAPEPPCVEPEEEKETKEPVEPETEVEKPEPEPEPEAKPEEKDEKEEVVVGAE